MFGDFVSKNKKETAATTGKMTDVATGESLPITTVSSDTKITQNDPGVNAYSMQHGEKNSQKAGQGELSLATDTVDETELEAAPITIGTEPYYAGVIIIRETNKQHFYVHEVITKKGPQRRSRLGPIKRAALPATKQVLRLSVYLKKSKKSRIALLFRAISVRHKAGQINRIGWADDLFSVEDKMLLNDRFVDITIHRDLGDAVRLKGNSYLLDVNNKIVIIGGSFNNPAIHFVMAINANNATYAQEIKEVIFEYEKSRSGKDIARETSKRLEIYETFVGKRIVRTYSRQNFGLSEGAAHVYASLPYGFASYGYTGKQQDGSGVSDEINTDGKDKVDYSLATDTVDETELEAARAADRAEREQALNETLKQYEQAVDESLLDFIVSVRSMTNEKLISKRKYKIGKLSKEHTDVIQSIIKKETGKDIDLTGYELWINGSGVQHINARHGKNGKKDQSMKNDEDIARMPWVVDNADGGSVVKDVTGDIERDVEFSNSDGTAALQVRLEKQIADETFYVVECVPDSEQKRVYIKSAYIKKGDKGQELNVENDSPQPTSETILDGNVTNHIVQNQNDVVKNYSLGTDTVDETELEAARAADKAERFSYANLIKNRICRLLRLMIPKHTLAKIEQTL